MIAEMFQAVSEIPESEGSKVGITCPCGGTLQTITDEFSIETQDRIGAKEIVRCVRCEQEFDVDDNQRLRVEVSRLMITPAQIQNAIAECPRHRIDIRMRLRALLFHAKRGIEIKDNAPAWIEAQNVIFVSKVDKGTSDDEVAA
jgi:hypothetical protein